VEAMGDRIKWLREGKGLKAVEVAESLGMKQSYYSDVENNRRTNLTTEVLKKLADFYDCTIDFIVTGEPIEQPLTDFLTIMPPELQEFVRLHGDEAWISLVKRMSADELTPGDVQDIIEAVKLLKKQFKE
jgi:transcriptional regulator with XRE-family HTH domain